MSTTTKSLAINTGQWAHCAYGANSWNSDENGVLYAARDAQHSYYVAKLSFNTNNVNWIGIPSLTLSLKTSENSNPYGTCAVLSTESLKPHNIYDVIYDAAYFAFNEADIKNISGYITHKNCTSHTVSETKPKDTIFSYDFGDINLSQNTTYYIYIIRRISSNTNLNGWTAFYSPCASSNAVNPPIVLEYKAPHVNIHNGTEFKKYIPYVYDDGKFKRCIPYIHNGTKWVKYSG